MHERNENPVSFYNISARKPMNLRRLIMKSCAKWKSFGSGLSRSWDEWHTMKKCALIKKCNIKLQTRRAENGEFVGREIHDCL